MPDTAPSIQEAINRLLHQVAEKAVERGVITAEEAQRALEGRPGVGDAGEPEPPEDDE